MNRTLELTNNQKVAKVIARRREYQVAREQLPHEDFVEFVEMVEDEFERLGIDIKLFICTENVLKILLKQLINK